MNFDLIYIYQLGWNTSIREKLNGVGNPFGIEVPGDVIPCFQQEMMGFMVGGFDHNPFPVRHLDGKEGSETYPPVNFSIILYPGISIAQQLPEKQKVKRINPLRKNLKKKLLKRLDGIINVFC